MDAPTTRERTRRADLNIVAVFCLFASTMEQNSMSFVSTACIHRLAATKGPTRVQGRRNDGGATGPSFAR